jgi:hypothetical protein
VDFATYCYSFLQLIIIQYVKELNRFENLKI